MERLNFLTQEELLHFFRRKKTEMSCMDQPQTFLCQLRDHNLVSEKLYQRVTRMKTKEQKKKGVYDVLDCLETDQPEQVKTFWECVFTDHIMQQYPTLRQLRNSLMDGEKCILYQNQWYTPSEFEKLGGKERSKNWRTSIRYRNTTLKKLFQKHKVSISKKKSN